VRIHVLGFGDGVASSAELELGSASLLVEKSILSQVTCSGYTGVRGVLTSSGSSCNEVGVASCCGELADGVGVGWGRFKCTCKY